MTTPTVTAAALALLLATVPAAGQPLDAHVAAPAPTTATDVAPTTPAAPDGPAETTATGYGSAASSTPEAGTPDASTPDDEATSGGTETGSGLATEVGTAGDDVSEDVLQDETETIPGATVTDESTTTDAVVADGTGAASDLEELAGPADPAEAVTAPVEVSSEPAAEPADGEVAEQVDVTPRLVVAPGYQEDGYDRPFWWGEDGLHFRDPIPASGYVNINVPGADNVSIDSHRELIGQTFIPWSYFKLQPGMCIAWTESNGYSYHFGEDNSGRGGVDEKDWEFCVPDSTDPDEPVVPDPDDPDEPDQPDVPEDPDVPDQPIEPDTPDTPDVPDQPQTPEQPMTPAGPDASTDVPESIVPVVEVPLSTASESVPAADATTTAATDEETGTPGALAVTGLGAGSKSLLAAAAALGLGGGLMALASKTKQR